MVQACKESNMLLTLFPYVLSESCRSSPLHLRLLQELPMPQYQVGVKPVCKPALFFTENTTFVFNSS